MARLGWVIACTLAMSSAGGAAMDCRAAESALGMPALSSCTANDGEWSWRSEDLDIAVGVEDGWVSYVDLVVRRTGVCADLGPMHARIVTRGSTSADCVWSDNLCQSDLLGVSAWVLFREPEDHLAMCNFKLRRTQPTCETCAVLQNVTLTRQPPTAVEARSWGRVKFLYR